MKNLILMFFFAVSSAFTYAKTPQNFDTTKLVYVVNFDEYSDSLNSRTPLKKMVAPVLLITYGVASLENPHLQKLNTSWQNKVKDMKMKGNGLDDYTQFAPMAFVYGLNLAGVKGNHDIGDVAAVNVISFLLSTAIVRPIKQLTNVERPDGSNHHSFPSGHTSTAFVSAQLMFREYQGKDVVLSLLGYPFAVYTALYRTVNNKHWLGDVVAGAGIGILSTELAYYMLPHVKKLFNKKSKSNFAAYPIYQNKAYGLGMTMKL